jgi:hypothetical protein
MAFFTKGKINQGNPRSSVLLKKLVDSQFVKNVFLLWNPKFYYLVHKSAPSDPALIPLHCLHLRVLKSHLNIILPPTTRSIKLSPSGSVRYCNIYPIRATCPIHRFLPDLITLLLKGEK